jgi:cytoskeletal protein RodZ
MGRNEIRLRRQRMSSGRIAQHRNYGDIMARHDRELRFKRITRIFTYFILILVIILLFYFMRIWERREKEPSKQSTSISQPAKVYSWSGTTV